MAQVENKNCSKTHARQGNVIYNFQALSNLFASFIFNLNSRCKNISESTIRSVNTFIKDVYSSTEACDFNLHVFKKKHETRLFAKAVEVTQLLIDDKFYQAASSAGQKLLDIKLKSRAAHRILARSYEGLGDFDFALKHWFSFVKLTTTVEEQVYNRISILQRILEIENQLEKILKFNKNYSPDQSFAQIISMNSSSCGNFFQRNRPGDSRIHKFLLNSCNDEISALYGEYRYLVRCIKNGLIKSNKNINFINSYDLREFFKNKTVAVVANSSSLVSSNKGSEIDSHDVVIRFNSFKIIPLDTGQKTTIHVAIHLHEFNLNVPVEIRMLFSGDPKMWRKAIRNKINPEAQIYVADASLRYPVKSSNLVNDLNCGIPTTGFNVIRLLKLYGTASLIRLYGFDFYESGILRLEEAESLPISETHNYDYEKDWIFNNSTLLDHVTRELVLGPKYESNIAEKQNFLSLYSNQLTVLPTRESDRPSAV